jgi:sulfur carrier protein
MSDACESIVVHVNDRPRVVARGTGLAALLDDILPHGSRGVAVAVNDSVVPRTRWAEHRLAGGEQVLIIRASQGG